MCNDWPDKPEGITSASWDLIHRLDDALPKGHPLHRLVITATVALPGVEREAIATYLASPEAESALAKGLIVVEGAPNNSGRTDWKPEAAIILASWRKSVKA